MEAGSIVQKQARSTFSMGTLNGLRQANASHDTIKTIQPAVKNAIAKSQSRVSVPAEVNHANGTLSSIMVQKPTPYGLRKKLLECVFSSF